MHCNLLIVPRFSQASNRHHQTSKDYSCLVASLQFVSDVVIFNLYSDANWNFPLVSCGINDWINSCKIITVDLKFHVDIEVQSAKAKSKYEGIVYQHLHWIQNKVKKWRDMWPSILMLSLTSRVLLIFLLRNTVLQFKIAIIFRVFVFLDSHVTILMYNHSSIEEKNTK